MIPKFRAWWIQDEVMTHIYTLEFLQGGIRVSDGCWHEKFLGDEVILMQSTGLKDTNGVEIFEGDIVRYTWDMLSDVNATEKGKKVRISKVFWSDWRASWAVGKKSCNNDLFRYARNGNTVEVIGNIYENPELLNIH
ncbi:YopX family protein [Enterococcus dongliensis]|uniref:YopX family protein n=1 Tax=Enterococcus dongliensis TaxID=2559925 RepID=A0AAW8THQ1_9ENTE|nr:YopX family protein [Enterococcus dongliensis]MDT2635091.1 YopX family protein [Enterococcus dongliensis]MDT2636227.1 YopX family protein [Enterococcus dongliensis]MDT2643761.1 YopX family protein [Enterococcus dongliensis]